MRHALKYSGWWLAGGCVLVAVVVGGSLAPSGIDELPLPSDKINHLLAYFVLMIWFGGIYRNAVHWRVAVALTALGIALEWLQQLGGARQGDVMDFLANSGGVLLGLVASALIPGGWCRHAERLFGH
ncbi:MAG: VanZ family protein [Pseudomonadota bacterium]